MTRRLLMLNGLAAIAAVSHHSIVWGLTAMVWWADRHGAAAVPDYGHIGGAEFYALRLVDQVAMAAVPAFLWVSGYFVPVAAASGRSHWGWAAVLNRIKALLPAYALWSLAAVSLEAADGAPVTVAGVSWKLLTGSAAPPFYYVPMLVQLYLLSPVLAQVARRSWKPFLLTAAVVQLSANIMRSLMASKTATLSAFGVLGHLAGWDPAAYIFWFAFGIVAGCHIGQFKALLLRARSHVPLLLGLAYALAFVEWEVTRRARGLTWISGGVTVSDNLLAFALLIAFLARQARDGRIHSTLTRIGCMSYGIYLMHVPVLEVAARTTYHLLPALLSSAISLQAALVAVGVTVPVLSMLLVKASPFRRYYGYMFG